MKLARIILLLLVSLATVGVACAAEYTLRLGTDQPVGHPYNKGVHHFANAVAKHTHNAVKIKIYPDAQLGDSPAEIEGLHFGMQDMTLAAFSHTSQFCKEFGLFGAPYLFKDQKDFAAVFDGRVAGRLDQACKRRYGIRLLSTFTSGFRNEFNRDHPVNKPADLNGLKIRTMEGQADAESWKAFGAIPAPIAYSELYSALQAGVVDGAEGAPASMLDNKFYETASYISLTHHLVLPMGLFISEHVMSELPIKYQTIIQEDAVKAAHWEWAYMRMMNEKALKIMQTKFDVTVNKVKHESAFRAMGRRVQNEVAKQLHLKNLLASIRAAEQRY